MQTYQENFEAVALSQYNLFLHRQARAYYNMYMACAKYGAIDYEEFYQEAALGLVQAIRTLQANTLPLSAEVIVYAKQYIRNLIFRNLVLRYDGVHRQASGCAPGSLGHKTRSSTFHENPADIIGADPHATFDDVEFYATLDTLPPAMCIVAICMINGMSRREIERRNILPRRTITHAIERLRTLFANPTY